MADDLTPILVTGAGGYLGGEILTILRSKGVHALAVGRSESCDIYCDLCDLDSVRSLIHLHPCSLIIHCAAAVPKSQTDYFDQIAGEKSLEMVANLLEAGLRNIVFASTMTVYPEGISLAREEDAVRVGKSYPDSKLAAEQLLLEHSKVTSAILRIPGLFGRPRKNGVLYRSACALARGQIPDIDKSLPQWAAIHVRDAAKMFVRAAVTFPPSSTILNVGYPGRMAIADAVRQLAGIFGCEFPLPQPQWFEFELSKLHSSLGPVPGTFYERLIDLADWARNKDKPSI